MLYSYIILLYYFYAGSASYYSCVADHVVKWIENKRSLVYTDFVKDVVPLSIALRERGYNSWSYHGKNMTSHDKTKAVDSWCPQDSDIQVRYFDLHSRLK